MFQEMIRQKQKEINMNEERQKRQQELLRQAFKQRLQRENQDTENTTSDRLKSLQALHEGKQGIMKQQTIKAAPIKF